MKNVHLEPYTWRDQLVIVQRELSRARTHLELAASRNRDLPKLEMVATEEEYRKRYREAVREFIAFLRDRQVFTVPTTTSRRCSRGKGGSSRRHGCAISSRRSSIATSGRCAATGRTGSTWRAWSGSRT